LGLSAAVSFAIPLTAHADDQDTIDYRQHVMRTLGEEVAALNLMLERKVPPDSFATHVKVLAVVAQQAKKAFEPEVVGGHAKAEIWDKWDDFAKRLDELVASTANVAKVAESGGMAAAAPAVPAALTCKGCHDTYRVPKN
jgi:cytochrome c556